jgi:hypothetical protein
MLQHALWKTNHHCICVSPLNTVILADWLQVAITVHDHPVGIHMLVPACPTYIGAMDASKQGMGRFLVGYKLGQVHAFVTIFMVCNIP